MGGGDDPVSAVFICERLVTDRLYAFLVENGGEVGAEEIAAEALGLRGARGAIADRIVATAASEDPRVVRGTTGWTIAAPSSSQKARNARYLMIAEGGRDGTQWIAVRGLGFDGAEKTVDGAFEIDDRAKAIHTLEGIEDLAANSVAVAFRLPGVRERINRQSRTWLGRAVLPEDGGLCLFRLARRRFPDRSFASLDSIAEALGMACVTERGLREEVELGGELLLGLLERCETEGLADLEDIEADQYPLKEAVRFASYAFEEADLATLPAGQGVYIMRDREGEVIYVGKSKHLRDRVRTYFADQTDRPEKTRKILERIWSVDVEEVGSEVEALILEARLIQACRPSFNTQVDVHERPGSYEGARRYLLLLPSSDPDSVELFWVDDRSPIEQIRVRLDRTDWAAADTSIGRLFESESPRTARLADEDRAAHRILGTWMAHNHEMAQVIHVDDSAGREDLCRVVEDAIVDFGAGEVGKTWRI